jgi:hypothetical protein
MERPIQSLDEDITYTLEKIQTLLEYSTRTNAEEVLALVTRARQVWGEETQQDCNWTNKE